MVLIEMASINILELYMVLKVLIEIAFIKILKLYITLKVLINMVKLKLAKQNLLKINKEKDMSIYLLLYLKYILIIVQNN